MPHGVVFAILLCSAIASADPYEDAKRRAVTLFEEGRALAAQGRDADACDRFLQSLELEPAAGTELNLADCLQRQGYLRRAWGYYDHVARIAKRDGDSLRAKFARERAELLVPQLATIVIKLADGDASVTINERVVAGEGTTRRDFADPGEVEVAATAPGRATHKSKLTASKGKTSELAIPALAVTAPTTAALSPRRRRSWVYTAATLGGLAAVDLIIAAVATNTAFYRQDEFEKAGCAAVLSDDYCSRKLYDIQHWQERAMVLTLTGVALAGTAAAVYILAPPERTSIAPTVSSDRVGLVLVGRF